jgi:signal transduction histidine kinase
VPALESLAAGARIPVTLAVDIPARCPEATEVAAYYVVVEALANATRYAGASAVDVAVTSADGLLVVEVRDDGRGGAEPEAGTGLRGLADRVDTLGGRFVVESASGRGTRVRAELPVETDGAERLDRGGEPGSG